MFNGRVDGEGDQAGMMNGGSLLITTSETSETHSMQEHQQNQSHGTREEVTEGGITTTTYSEHSEHSSSKSSNKKNAQLDYVKQMRAQEEGKMERRKELTERIKRKPKTLDVGAKYAPTNKQEAENQYEHQLMQEQDVIASHTIGLDYRKQQFETKTSLAAPTDRAGRSPSPGPPAKQQYVEKVAHAENARDLFSQFESGKIENSQIKIRKLNPLLDLCAEGSISESAPVARSDVVREGDYDPYSGNDITKGLLKPLSERWNENGEDFSPSPTKHQIALSDLVGEAQICQNTPQIRSDVCRESDTKTDTDYLEKGYTQALLKQWATPKEQLPERKQQLVLKELEKVEIDNSAQQEYDDFRTERLQRLQKLKKNVLVDADKIAQPNISKKLGAQFEKGEFYDGHTKEYTKKKIVLKDAEGSVSESTPQMRTGDIVHSSDTVNGEELERGGIKSLRDQWNKKGEVKRTGIRRPVVLNDLHAEGGVCESTPTARSDVVRESDSTNGDELRVGITKSIRSSWGRRTSHEEKKSPIVLSDLHGDGGVCENTPQARTDVVRESDSTNGEELQVGFTKSIRAQWGRGSEERLEKKPPIVLKDLKAEGSVCESTPQARTDVVRESDSTNGEELQVGYTKSIRAQWGRNSEERTEKKQIVLSDLHAEGSVCENTPQTRTDVVRESDSTQGEALQKGYTKSIRQSWGRNSQERTEVKQLVMTDLQGEGSVCESTPESRTDVVRESDSTQGESLQKGYTKSIRQSWGRNSQERTEVKQLVMTDLQGEGSVCESTPESRTDVVRESDSTQEALQKGNTKTIRQSWGKKTQEHTEVKQLVLTYLQGEGSVCESTPESRTDVVRESDSTNGEELQVGFTKSIRAQWGRNSEERPATKKPIDIKEGREGKVCESTPQMRVDVVRESDMNENGGEELQKGFTKSRLQAFTSTNNMQNKVPKSPINMDLAEGSVCESNPLTRADVVRESDQTNGEELQKGFTKSRLQEYKRSNSQNNQTPKQPLQLDLAEGTGCESNPEQRTDVVRESDQTHPDVHQKGFTKSRLQQYTTVKYSDNSPNQPINMELAEGNVCESNPQLRSDVIRESDQTDGEVLQKGFTKSRLQEYTHVSSQKNNVAKQPLHMDLAEGTVCESEPQLRTDVIRESDQCGGEELQVGFTKSRLHEYKQINIHENNSHKQPLQLDLAEGSVCESNPEQRTDVLRESDQSQQEVLQKGFTKSRLQQYTTVKYTDNGPSQIINMDLAEGNVCESNPQLRTDLVRESDQSGGEELQRGLTKSRMQEYRNVATSSTAKQQFQLELAEGTVCESEPVARSDVIRESDQSCGDSLQKGFTKSRLQEYKQIKQTNNNSPKQPINLKDLPSEGAVCESTPTMRTDVIRESDQHKGEELEVGFTKSRLQEFTHVNTDTVTTPKPQIVIHGEGTVCESSPVARSDVYRESTPDLNGFNPGEHGVELQKGLTKSRREEYIRSNDDEIITAKQPIVLGIDGDGAVCESVPVLRSDVYRESTANLNGEELQKGFTKSRLEEYTRVNTEENNITREPIILNDLLAEGAVSENMPQSRTDVVRESDHSGLENDTRKMTQGHTKSRMQEYTHVATSSTAKQQFQIELAEGTVCESEPVLRTDVIRESDQCCTDSGNSLQKGLTKSRLEEFTNINSQENITIKQPINLNNLSEGSVCESEPQLRTDVVRESDSVDGEALKIGYTKSRLEEFSRVNEENNYTREPIVLNDLLTEGAVCENTPQQRTDVVRESDHNLNSSDAPQKGSTRSRLQQIFTQVEQTNSNTARQPINLKDLQSGGAVCESSPQARTDVIRESDQCTGEELEVGFTKSRLQEFTHVNTDNITTTKAQIVIHGEGSVCESSPVIRSDLYRESTPDPNGFNPVEHGKELQKGLTKSRREEYNRVNRTENIVKQPLVLNDLLAEGAVCENTPQSRTDVVRESDYDINSGDALQKGLTKSRLEEYTRVNNEENKTTKEPIILDNLCTEGVICENTPQARTDVVRESDHNINSCDSLQKGHTKSRLVEFTNINSQEHITIKQPINLNDLSEGSVCESEPQLRTDVVRESDSVNINTLQRGYTNLVCQQWEQGPDDSPQTRTPIELRDLCGEGKVCESEPVTRADVYRESDINLEAESIQCGIARQLKEQILLNDPDLELIMEGGQEVGRDMNQVKLQHEMASMSLKDRMSLLDKQNNDFDRNPSVRDGGAWENDRSQGGECLNFGNIKQIQNHMTNRPQDIKRQPIIIPQGNGPAFSESEPIARTDVVRHDDTIVGEIFAGASRAKQLWQDGELEQQHTFHKKKPFKMELAAESGILESTPTVRNDVVKSDNPPTNGEVIMGASKLKQRWQSMEEPSSFSKKPFKMELDMNAVVLESTPSERPDVASYDQPVEDFVLSKGRSKSMAERFLKAAAEVDEVHKPHRQAIEIDRSAGVVLESTPEVRNDIVKSGGPTGWEIDMEAGRTRHLMDSWKHAAETVDDPEEESKSNPSGLPYWMLELEAARQNSGVFESTPEYRDDLVREHDMNFDDQPEYAPNTGNMKNMWENREHEDPSQLPNLDPRGRGSRRWSKPEPTFEPEPEPIQTKKPSRRSNKALEKTVSQESDKAKSKRSSRKVNEPPKQEAPKKDVVPRRNFAIGKKDDPKEIEKRVITPPPAVPDDADVDPNDFRAVLLKKKRAKMEAIRAVERAAREEEDKIKAAIQAEKDAKSQDNNWIKRRGGSGPVQTKQMPSRGRKVSLLS